MAKRALSVSNKANHFLCLVDAAGSIKGQKPPRFISLLAKDVYEVLFDLLPEGRLSENPVYQGRDPDFPGYSRYDFNHRSIAGTYASTAEHVILLDLRLAPRLPDELFKEEAAEQVA